MLESYLKQEAERQKLGIPPLPLNPDETAEVCRALIDKYPSHRIVLVEKENGGSGSARNAGLRTAKGKYFLLLDADDRIAPETLQKFR